MSTKTAQKPPQMAAEMALIHRIFRRGFREMATIVQDVPPTGLERSKAVAEHVGFYLDSLHAHHTTEDELVWPLLRQRAPDLAALTSRMEEQHQGLAAAMTQVRLLADRWAAAPTAAASSDLATAIEDLREVLVAHLDEEERDVVPLIVEHLTPSEWAAVGEAGFAKFAPKERPIAMGQLLEVATPHEAAAMFADLPVVVKLFWRLAGKRQYRKRVESVRGRPVNPLLNKAFAATTPWLIRAYEKSDGRRGGTAKGVPVLLITVAGRRTGLPRTTPVAYFPHDGAYLVCGSAGGTQREPQWFGNLRRAGRASVRIGAKVLEVDVRIPDRAERDRLWSDVVLTRAPFFAGYEQKSSRVIPIGLLTPSN